MNDTLLCAYCAEPVGAAPAVPHTSGVGVMLTRCTACGLIGPSVLVSSNHMLVRVIALDRQLRCEAEKNVKELERVSVVVKLVPFYASEQR